MCIDEKNYAIVWKPVPSTWTMFDSNGPVPELLPYLLYGNALVRHQSSQRVTLDEQMLLLGLLYVGWEAGSGLPATSNGSRPRDIKEMIYRLCLRSRFDSLEEMVLVLSGKIRRDNGRLPALKILISGCRLLPRSAEIRSELILDVWALVEASEKVDRQSAFQLIINLHEGIDFERLNEQVFDILDYIHFVALSYLGDYQKRNWLFWRVIAKRIRHKGLKHRMIRLLNCRPIELTSEPVFWTRSARAM